MRLTLPLVLLLSFPAAAQYTVGKVTFLNPGPYPEPDLLTLAAIHPGDSLTRDQLQLAARRLSNSGYFTEVTATVDGPFRNVDARFKLTPIPATRLYQPTYANLVWLSPDDLAAFTRATPLLSLGLPDAGNRQDAVQSALQALLSSRNVQATLSHQLVEPSTGQPRRLVAYRAETPAVTLHSATLTGIPPALAAAFQSALRHAQAAPYNEGLLPPTTASLLLQPFADSGYIEAHLDNLQRTISPQSTPAHTLVELSATVIPGQPWHVSTVTFTPTPVESAEAFSKADTLKPGALASRRDLDDTLNTLTNDYHAQGYMDAVAEAAPTLDQAAHQVAYTVAVVPGAQYRLSSVHVTGLPPAVRPDFDQAFRLKPGDIYNESYVGTFLVHNNRVASLQPYAGIFTASAGPDTHLVDLTITFSPASSVNVH